MQRAAYRRRMAAVVAIVLLLPGALYAAGVRSSQFENHALAPFPTPDAGWDYFRNLSTWTTDNIPLRQQGVQVTNWIDENLFNDPPGSNGGGGTGVPGIPSVTYPGLVYPSVIYGRDGYLFYGEDIRLKCEPPRTVEQIIGAIDALARAVQQSGREFVLMVAPDKSTVLPDLMPAFYPGRECAAQRSRQMRDALDGLEYAPDLFSVLSDVAVDDPAVYLPLDTHWGGAGGEAFIRTLVTTLAPGIESSFEPRELRPSRQKGDLTVLAGRPELMTVRHYALHSPRIRENWQSIEPISESAVLHTASGPPGTQVEGTTLLIGDSFLDAAGADLPYFFESSIKVHHGAASSDPATLVSNMIAADAVVIEMVERQFASGDAPLFNASFIDAALAALASNPR